MQRKKPQLRRWACAMILAAGASTSWGVDFTWNTSAGGLFDTAGNWTPVGGPPDTNTDSAIFNLSNTYTVTLQTDKTNNQLRMVDGTVTLALSGQTYALTSAAVGNTLLETARLNVNNGTVTGDLDIGTVLGATGFVTIGANGNWNAGSNSADIGLAGVGTLTISNGGAFTGTGFFDIGANADSFGTVTVSGVGSALNTELLNVGAAGSGALTISGGGTVTTGTVSTLVRIGASGSGDVLVTGEGSLWQIRSNDCAIGRFGVGTITITDGGKVTNTQIVTLGSEDAAARGTVTVRGAGSRWETSIMTIGDEGTGVVDISRGAVVTASSTTLGDRDTGQGTLTIDGPGSAFFGQSSIVVGSEGTGSARVSNGGTLTSDLGFMAFSAGSSGRLEVTGAGSTWTARRSVFVGGGIDAAGGDGDLVVSAGAVVNIGTLASDTLKIWNSTGTFLSLSGGTINTRSFERLGGFSFSDGVLNVNGGTFSNAAVPTVLTLNGNTDTALPTLRLIGGATSSNVAALALGDTRRAALEVRDGSGFTNTTAVLGNATGSEGTAVISGTGSLWTNTSSLTLGASGTGTLTISDGASVISAGTATIAQLAGSGGTVTIAGAGSSWNNAGGLEVGSSGTAAITITDGGSLTSLAAAISRAAGAGSVRVSGAGSTWTAASIAIGGNLGTNGGQGTLTIESGGAVDVAGATEIRNSPGSALIIDGGTLSTSNLTKLGALVHRDGVLHVKAIFDNGAAPLPLVIDGGGPTDLATLRLSGNFAVSDVTSLIVGDDNHSALILDGGRRLDTSTNNISIGAKAFSSGVVTVEGAGTMLTTKATLAVGGIGTSNGGPGTLNIGSGSSVEAGVLGIFSQGVVNLNGGQLRFGAIEGKGGRVNFNSGSVLHTTPATIGDSELTVLLGPSHVLGPEQQLLGGGNAITLGAPLTIDGGLIGNAPLITNDSVLNLRGGTVISLVLINNAGRLLRLSGTADVNANGGITNNGTVQLENNIVPTSDGPLTNNGTIRGTGLIGNNLSNNDVGQVQATGGNRIEFQGATNANSGVVSLTGGEIVFTRPLTNSASGVITGHDGILRASSGLNNLGSMAFTSGLSDVFGDVTNSPGGRIVVSGGGTATFYDDVAHNGAEIRVSAGGRAVFFGALTGGGPFTGTGTTHIEGDLRPGNSPAIVNFGGDLVFSPTATLEMELGGTTPGTGHDQINVAGQATLDGTMNVVLINGFTPSAGNEFRIMTFGSRVGTFDVINGLNLAGGLTLTPIYSATDLILRAGGVVVETAWAVDNSGLASVATNWTNGVPNAAGVTARFGNVITQPRTVTVDQPFTMGRIIFDNNNAYTLTPAGAGKITLLESGGNVATIQVLRGSHTINAPVASVDAVDLDVAGGASLTMSQAYAVAAGQTLSKKSTGAANLSGGITLGNGSSMAVEAGSLSTTDVAGAAGSTAFVAAGATLTANRVQVIGLTVNGTANVRPSGNGDTHNDSGTSVVGTLALGPAGKLDIGNNGLVIRTASVLDVRAAINAGRGTAPGGVANGDWDGTTGITSSSAAAQFILAGNEARTIGYGVNKDLLFPYATFMGRAVGPDDILVRYTRMGDFTLDGRTDDNDVSIISGFYNVNHDPVANGPRLWSQGDTNADGIINDADVSVVGGFYAPALAPLSPQVGVVAVPEVGGVAGVLIGVGLAGRRRGRR